MKKALVLGIFYMALALALALFCPFGHAEPLKGLDLLNNAKEYDKKDIVYQGEVIGDIMVRGEHAWLHVNDGTVAIGIWVSKAMAQEIHYAGHYRTRGDMVEVFGVFHRACLEHGGDLDIHASEMTIVSSGGPAILTISRRKVYAAFLSLIFVLLYVRGLK